MMDAADQRLPTFSVNARRKFFHALAVVMFVPGIAFDVSALASQLCIELG
jgi:dolichol kinase